MKLRLKVSTADWQEALCLVGFFLFVFFIVPLAPKIVKATIGLLISASMFWALATALGERWRASKTAGSFFGYYFRLVIVGFAVFVPMVLFLLLIVWVVTKLYVMS